MRRPRPKKHEIDEGWRRYAYSPIGVIILLVGVVALGNGVVGVFAKWSRSNRASGDASAEVARLQARRDALEAQVAELMEERGIEAQLRDDFQIVRDNGEEVIQIIDETATGSDQ